MYSIATSSLSVLAPLGFFDFLSTVYGVLFSVVGLLIVIAVIAGMWLVFQKAGEAGWKSIIPIYNVWVLMEIIGRPGWWVILYFLPAVGWGLGELLDLPESWLAAAVVGVVSFVIWVITMVGLAESFDRGIGFAIGLMFLPMLFYPLLGFSDMQYYGPAAKA